MKVSLNLAQYYSNVDLKSIKRDELQKRIGEQLGAVEETIDWAPKFKGVVVAKVVSCVKHPNADRLNVCMIDDGRAVKGVNRDSKGLVQVVCGAPNVRDTLHVAWIPPGVVVPSTRDKDPMTLDARELRGVVSNGMLASPHELGISDDHEGILEITEDDLISHLQLAKGKTVAINNDRLNRKNGKSQIDNASPIANRQSPMPKPGTPLAELFGLDDLIIDIENKMFTHRPDCFGNLGVARELAGISGLGFKSPEWYLKKPRFTAGKGLQLKVVNPVKKLVPRFMAVGMSGIEIKPSPVWLQSLLTRVGIKPINNVVDSTNFVMHLTGQPLHAFDYDKLASNQLGPRAAKKGEKLALLNGKTIELTEDDLVIATTDKAVGLAGIMGGSETQVDANTKNIVIECATFDMFAIRRTSMRHGLFTDAGVRYTKGQSPLQDDRALWYALQNIEQMAGGKVATAVFDESQTLHEPKAVAVEASFVNDRLGSKLSSKEIIKLLQNVEFEIVPVQAMKNKLHVRPPFWRTDIEEPEDVVEEVGRLLGFDRLPVELPPRAAKPPTRNAQLEFKQIIREQLKASGANEVLTYSFVHGDLLKKTGVDAKKQAYHIRNAISPDLQYYRTSLIPSLLEKVHPNLKSDLVRSDDNEFALFEIGRAHVKGQDDDEGLPKELSRLGLVFAADDKTAARKYKGSAFYLAKKYLFELTRGQAKLEAINDSNVSDLIAGYERSRTALASVGGERVGVIGEFNAGVRQALKLPDFCAGFELDLDVLQKQLKPADYQVLPTFPKTVQDLTLEVGAEQTYQAAFDLIWQQLQTASHEHGYFATLGPRAIFAAENSAKKRLSFRIWLSHFERTLTTDEVNKLLDQIAAAAQDQLKADRI